MFKMFVRLTSGERTSVQVFVLLNFSTIGERSNILDFPLGRPRFHRERWPTVLCTSKGCQLLGPGSLYEEVPVLRTLREVIGSALSTFRDIIALHSDRSNVLRFPIDVACTRTSNCFPISRKCTLCL